MIAIITQARINSTRLPNKIFLEASGKPFLSYHIERLKKTGLPVIIATTNNGSEKPIEDFCISNDLTFYKGDENDVLRRYYETAKINKVTTIIRVTSDCPLVDGDIILKGLAAYGKGSVNTYYSNALERTYPRGMDYEIFSFDLLEQAFQQATTLPDREHVTPYIWNNRLGNVKIVHDVNSEDNSGYRITLDTIEDKQLITRLIEEYDAASLNCKEIVGILKNDPSLANINKHIEQKKTG